VLLARMKSVVRDPPPAARIPRHSSLCSGVRLPAIGPSQNSNPVRKSRCRWAEGRARPRRSGRLRV